MWRGNASARSSISCASADEIGCRHPVVVILLVFIAPGQEPTHLHAQCRVFLCRPGKAAVYARVGLGALVLPLEQLGHGRVEDRKIGFARSNAVKSRSRDEASLGQHLS